jgi:hypothetical protein
MLLRDKWLAEFGVEVVYVFDGKPQGLKKSETDKRAE